MKTRPRVTFRELILVVAVIALAVAWIFQYQRATRAALRVMDLQIEAERAGVETEVQTGIAAALKLEAERRIATLEDRVRELEQRP